MKRQGNEESIEPAAWQYALKLLSYRQRSKREMRQSLQKKGFSEEIIISILDRLKAINLLDDNQFAHSWANYRLTSRPIGRIRLKYELQQHGISSSLAEEVVSKILTEETELLAALALAQRYRQRKGENDSRYYQRMARFLQQRGYNTTIIRQVLKKIAKHSDIDSEDLI